jgi:hypothetical protein
MYTQRKRAAAREDAEAAQDAEVPADGPVEPGESAREPNHDGSQNPQGPAERLTQESGTRSLEEAPEQASDPASDTASESTGPSGTGEKVDR